MTLAEVHQEAARQGITLTAAEADLVRVEQRHPRMSDAYRLALDETVL